jgi:hypothetical protein
MKQDDDRRRYFILTAGRTGSTLLAAILGDAGADFGMQVPDRWHPGTGEMEHAELRRAARWMRYAHQVSADRPPIGVRRYLWDIYRSLGKTHVQQLLKQARYVKGEDADFIVNPGFRMGFLPSIIVNYRRFEDYAVSTASMRGHTSLEILATYYNRVNRNALLWLCTFGGCVVSHQQLSDPDDTSWIAPLAAVTGLSAARLLEARTQRLGGSSPRVEVECFDAEAARTFGMIDALRGRVIPAGAQIQRSWRDKQRDAAAVELTSSGKRTASAASTSKP